MEKQKAHYDLSAVKARVEAVGMDAFSLAAKVGARNMSLTEEEALEVVMGLENWMLYKSMTTHADSRVWQDVYPTPCPNGLVAYIKS